ncbi:YihY/virulence factor BrkB family protein [Sphingomonas sp. IC-11]|uniref:YihY/virulence factor BrkB family protein n=1 Tax=Sphingomonas sp. IC-11 TaxID=2898528 RepID=UPI001E38EFC9|nr:YihY/virulence factor BrkB family protein [Sphingomonas sp. IC-11]MCD2315289.1 YihY/virulence factor BrkB family protein [Sphingomonas sp. IC-11]
MATTSPATVPSERGRDAASPWAIPPRGWKDVALRSWKEAGQDNISLVASGVAFCGVLAMVPMLGAIVLSYGLVATPETVMDNVRSLTTLMPADAARLIGEQLANVVSTSDGKKGFGLLIALAIALYGAMKGASAIITALNIAYDEEETRSFIKLNLIALAITAGAVVSAILAVVAIAAMSSLEHLFPSLPAPLLILGKILSYLIMAAVGAAAAATLYRFAPNRDGAKWVWLTPGSALASLSWLLMTIGFGIYVANFGSYDATYGSLGAAVVLLTWLYLSAYVLLLGAEFNCELERQTARDTTTGSEQPMGTRGAYAADTVAGGPQTGDEPTSGLRGSGVAEDKHPVTGTARSELALSRNLARALRIGTIGKVGLLPSLFATLGLTMMGKRDKTALGITFMAAAGGLKWLTRPGTPRNKPARG